MDVQKIISLLNKSIRTSNRLIAELEKEKIIEKKYYPTSLVVKIVDNFFGVKTNKKSRERYTVMARDILCVCLRRYTRLTLKEIAIMNNLKDHTSILAAIKRGHQYIDELDEIYELIEAE